MTYQNIRHFSTFTRLWLKPTKNQLFLVLWNLEFPLKPLSSNQKPVKPTTKLVLQSLPSQVRRKWKRILCFKPRFEHQFWIYPSFLNFVILPCNLKMKQKFTPTPLWAINDVKYFVKDKNTLMIWPIVIVWRTEGVDRRWVNVSRIKFFCKNRPMTQVQIRKPKPCKKVMNTHQPTT
jgi:hypothetical protein